MNTYMIINKISFYIIYLGIIKSHFIIIMYATFLLYKHSPCLAQKAKIRFVFYQIRFVFHQIRFVFDKTRRPTLKKQKANPSSIPDVLFAVSLHFFWR